MNKIFKFKKTLAAIGFLGVAAPISLSVVACGPIKQQAEKTSDQVYDAFKIFLKEGLVNSKNGGLINTAVNDSKYQIDEFLKEKKLIAEYSVVKVKIINNSKYEMRLTYLDFEPITFLWKQEKK